jgi:hypothetical protein
MSMREVVMSSIDSYWKYENRPAVLVNYGDDSVGGFYLQKVLNGTLCNGSKTEANSRNQTLKTYLVRSE